MDEQQVADSAVESPSGGVAVATKPVVRRRLAVGAAGGALALGLLAGGVSGGLITAARASAETDTAAASTAFTPPTNEEQVPSFVPPSWGSGQQQQPSTSTQSTATAASADQQVGVVTITTTLGYQDASAAGTGMVLTSDGLVLTNNHVIEGSTAIEVTIESTGAVYQAVVVGTDASSDVALLQLQDASGLATVSLDDDGGVGAGDAVTAVGNAEGGGDLLAAVGSVTALEQTMTASTETLSGLIEFSAAVVPGDSGGPVLDDEGEVIGMTTAASSGTVDTVAYAIDIEDALVIANQIQSGIASDTVTIGYPAFLGIVLGSGSSITGVLEGTPAAAVGLVAGDVITAVDGVSVSSLADLLDSYSPGDTVTLTWTVAATGESTSAPVTLIAGPAE
ncbi:trypsin-like peptidase domain-containing protein [uncultured Cellulomonas sp.]|uniref:S1C family serine protease n=1 Tax=uncultured Cellulomonas sp. TaxID=189682 RepID=UPI0028E2CA4E|nr:trypsin-like peptidase domain-containing protein [uncultured Cellulomonas sp.]